MAEPLLPHAREPVPLDASLTVSILSVAAVAVLATAATLAVFGVRAGMGVGIGGAVATANLWAFAHVVRHVLAGGPRGRLWGLFGALKLIVLAGGGYLLLKSGVVNTVALVLGYGALPLGITIGALLRPDDPGPEPPAAETAAAPPTDSGAADAKLVTDAQERDHA